MWPSCENQLGHYGGCLQDPYDTRPDEDDPQSDEEALVPESPTPEAEQDEKESKPAKSSRGIDIPCDEVVIGRKPGFGFQMLPEDTDAGDIVILDDGVYKVSKRGRPATLFTLFRQRQTPAKFYGSDRSKRAKSAPP